SIAEEALSKYNDYKNEKSLKAKVEAYTELSDSLKMVADHVKASKSIWQHLLSFFCYSSTEESNLYSVLHKVQEENIKTKVEQANSWLPKELKLENLNPFGWWAYKFLGPETFRWYGWDPVENFFKPGIDAVNASFKNACQKNEHFQFEGVEGKIKL